MEKPHVPFRFLNAWILHDDFYTFVEANWKQYPMVGGMRGLYSKIHLLKQDLRRWNRAIFGIIFSRATEAERTYSRMEAAYDQHPTPENRAAYSLAQAHLLRVNNKQVSFWAQKSRICWATEGKANSAYFHTMAKDRYRRQRIRQLTDSDGNVLEWIGDLGSAAVDYFEKLFTSEPGLPPIYSNVGDTFFSLFFFFLLPPSFALG